MTIATHARQSLYGGQPNTPNLTTATCAAHVLGTHSRSGAESYALPLPDGVTAACVVCALPHGALIGRHVIAWGKSQDRAVLYGGPPEDDGWDATSYGAGGAVHYTAFDRVAPADTPIPDKDSRVTVTKLARKRDYQDAGLWLLNVEGVDCARLTSYRTKKEALTDGLRRVAILDWHAARSAAAVA